MSELVTRLSGSIANRYTIQREIGRGGMATVYLANDVRHYRPVAIKVLHPHLALTLGPTGFSAKFKSPLACSTRTSWRSTTRVRPTTSSTM